MEPGIDGLSSYKRVIEINHHQKAIIVSGSSETDLGTGAYGEKS
jgi:hypothetical protein